MFFIVMGLLKTYPVAEGNHNNTHFLARDKKKNFLFRVVCFTESGEAFIMGHTSKIDISFLDKKELHRAIKEDLENKWDFILKTEEFEMFMVFENTEHLMKYYNAKTNLLKRT
jgi:hypothetical protein